MLDFKKKAGIQSWVGREGEWIWMELGRGENDKNALYEMPVELRKIINVILPPKKILDSQSVHFLSREGKGSG